MKKLLHIIATPRGEESRTLKIAAAVLQRFRAVYTDGKVDELNLFTEKVPQITIRQVDGKYALLGGKEMNAELKEAWKAVESTINRFVAADIYLLTVPMWNFSIPYLLKQYIDIIVQPKYLFQYTAQGPEGLLKNKKMIVVTTRGGDYSSDSPMGTFDLQGPYLRSIFGFAGIKDITFINAQPMDALGPQVGEQRLQAAIQQVNTINL